MSENDKKRELIIEAAMRRFSHFGVQKTTMNEIADDIAVTQPSLYYYFPDKTSLIVAVVEKISNDYFEKLNITLGGVQCLRDVFYRVIEFRKTFIERYFMLHLTDASTDLIIREHCGNILQNSREKEIEILARFIGAAIRRGDLDKVDPEKTSALFLDSLTGLSMWVISRSERKIYPDSGEFENIVTRQQELAEVFLRGLKYKDTSTCEV